MIGDETFHNETEEGIEHYEEALLDVNDASSNINIDQPNNSPRRQQLEADLWQARLGHCGEWQLKVLPHAVDCTPSNLHRIHFQATIITTKLEFEKYQPQKENTLLELPRNNNVSLWISAFYARPTSIIPNQISPRIESSRLLMDTIRTYLW